jgi:hypothetical protein
VLAVGPKFAGSNPTEDDASLRQIKIRSTTSFGGKVKPLVHVIRSYGMVKIPTSMKEILRRQNLSAISSPSFPASLLDVSAGNFQRALVNKLGTIRKADGERTIDYKWSKCKGHLVRPLLKDKIELIFRFSTRPVMS